LRQVGEAAGQLRLAEVAAADLQALELRRSVLLASAVAVVAEEPLHFADAAKIGADVAMEQRVADRARPELYVL